jgi:hypothetical protein
MFSDAVQFLIPAFAVLAAIVLVLTLAWLPGAIARNRWHSKQEAITVCGWLGLLFFPAWIVAMVWAHTEDNRRSMRGARGFPLDRPNGERYGIDELDDEIARQIKD